MDPTPSLILGALLVFFCVSLAMPVIAYLVLSLFDRGMTRAASLVPDRSDDA